MPAQIFFIAVPIVILIGVAIYFGIQAEKKRQAAFRSWSQQNDWRYAPARDRDVYHRFRFLDRLNKGSNRYAFHVLTGDWRGHSAIGFSFHYETHTTDSKGNVQTHHHHFGVVALQIEQSFPELRIQPEGWLNRFGHMLGMQDIDFESIQFSKAFEVKSEDKKLAYDFCHTGMMEYLLAHPKTSIELDGDWLAIFDTGKLEPHEIEPYLERLIKIRSHMPDYLFRA